MAVGRKVLRVCMESSLDSYTECIALKGDETEEDIESIAREAFFNWANYGTSIIDESEVPKDEEILE